MVHVRLEEGKRDANLPHDVCVVVARPFLHATTGPCHFLHRVLNLFIPRCATPLCTVPRQTPPGHRTSGTLEHVLSQCLSRFSKKE